MPRRDGSMTLVEKLRDTHQNISWKVGYGFGKEGLAFKCPFWADSIVFALAYMQGQGVEIPSIEELTPVPMRCATPMLREPGATISENGRVVWRNDGQEWDYPPAAQRPPPRAPWWERLAARIRRWY